LGHAYSALLAHDVAFREGGTFLLRIEDIDQNRCRLEWEAQIYDDLRWLGITWAQPVMRQSDRGPAYAAAISALSDEGLVYPCTCTRQDIKDALNAPQEGVPTHGPDGLVYPGTCRGRSLGTNDAALRLNVAKALDRVAQLGFQETGCDAGWHSIDVEAFQQQIGDIAIGRREMGTSYHLSVVIDDADQGVTHVVRGQDLFQATGIHVLLQRLLGLPSPIYHHHKLIRDDQGKRLAKRDDARALSKYRAEGATPQDIRRMVGL
jgi:glutamyl-Q tRNA(Asp) synthetase